MDTRGESTRVTVASSSAGGPERLPDLLSLDLLELETIGHPVLREVLEGLRERAGRSDETLWTFDSAID